MVQDSLPEPSMIDVLLCDHRDTMALLKHFVDQSKGSDNERVLEMLTDAVAMSIRLHSEGEFQVLYPWMEKQGEKKSVSHFLEVHHEIEGNVLTALENRKGGDELISTMDTVLKEFEEHLHEEEEGLVDVFENASAQELKDLAERFVQAKEKAPLTPQT